MSTQAQIEANRINSLASTGPRTPARKINSSRNATSHGLLSIAGARWRIGRTDRLLNLVLSGRLLEPVENDEPEQNEPNDPEIRIARMVAAKGDPIAKLERHRAAWERTYHRCMREFRAAHNFRMEQASDYDSAQQNEPTRDSVRPVMPSQQNEPTSGNATTYIRREPKIGRNDYCPCGSGLKYKKCCLNICVTPPAAA